MIASCRLDRDEYFFVDRGWIDQCVPLIRLFLETVTHHLAMNAPWIKAYVNSTNFRSAAEGFIRELFTTKIEEARHYESREEAQIDVHLICDKHIEIDTLDGHLHTLENFQVEERAPKEFVISVEGPFIEQE